MVGALLERTDWCLSDTESEAEVEKEKEKEKEDH